MEKKKFPLNSISSPPLAEDDLGAVVGGTMTANDYRNLAHAEGRTRPMPGDWGPCECGARMSRFCKEVIDGPDYMEYLDVKCYACNTTYESIRKKKPGSVDNFVPPGR